MKKIVLLFLIFFLASCNTRGSSYLERYYFYANKIEQNRDFLTKPQNYSARLIVNQLNSNEYRYDVIIDKPLIAMRNIRVLVLVDGIEYRNDDYIFPSLGIFEEESYGMIPFQVNEELNFYKGINLSLLANDKNAVLKVYVTYRNEISNKTFEDFLILRYEEKTAEESEEDIDEEKEESEEGTE